MAEVNIDSSMLKNAKLVQSAGEGFVEMSNGGRGGGREGGGEEREQESTGGRGAGKKQGAELVVASSWGRREGEEAERAAAPKAGV